jgi:hypothetical protein
VSLARFVQACANHLFLGASRIFYRLQCGDWESILTEVAHLEILRAVSPG